MAEISNYLGYQRHHHPEKNCTSNVMRMKQNQTGREVCTVGIADDNQSSRTEPISFGSGADELR
jgi:hypothetical protein